ncbi:MAG: SpoIID/LytB domain-containing protein [Deltaproteobacteria bacterium]|nr:SpoIID/LytB domain-containing protein [Deltaproteobacteria bacterium]
MSDRIAEARAGREPRIAVGVIADKPAIRFQLHGAFVDGRGQSWPAGEYLAEAADVGMRVAGARSERAPELRLTPGDPLADHFSLLATIGIDFHWQRDEEQRFAGALHIIASGAGRLTAIDEVPLETYLASVICSEMGAGSPPEFLRSHAVISRSWLLAQLVPRGETAAPVDEPGERIRWYDRDAHRDFDVCADDHCQRYQGLTRITSPWVAAAVQDTRGQVLTHAGAVCDARFYKCCGGVTEDFGVAWSDTAIPYLVPVRDAADPALPEPPLTDEQAARAFITGDPPAFCNCRDAALLSSILPSYDQETADFYRWQVRLTAVSAAELVSRKLGVEVGRVLALTPLSRGLSGRIDRLRIAGERQALVVGKELEIRRALSESHLYSSAFVVDTEGDPARPDAFVLHGAGWGHGVGLCQIGAAAMAAQGYDHRQILAHYYPGAQLERWYR